MTNRNDDDGHSEAWNKASKEAATRVGVAVEDGDSCSDCLSAKRLVATHTHTHTRTPNWALAAAESIMLQTPVAISSKEAARERHRRERDREREGRER